MIRKISIVDCKTQRYPNAENRFRPDTAYPEYLFDEISPEPNGVYAGVRDGFAILGLDREKFATAEWNPLGAYIRPGDNVLIKPNMVMDVNGNPTGGTDCLYTQPAVVAAVIDYILLALKGSGQIIIGDAPMQECNFENLLMNSGYKALQDYYASKGIEIRIVDFRELSSVVKNGVHYSTIHDGAKGKIVNIENESDFYGSNQSDRIRITNYDPRILPTHHHDTTQEYYVSDYILNADVIINMPKPKTHRKAGVTISLKNFVGANVRKEYLPHHTLGSVAENGDEYLNESTLHSIRSRLLDRRNILSAENEFKKARRIQRLIRACSIMMKLGKKSYSEGSWYGNHTISRTINDLNKIIRYADKNGKMQPEPQRKMFIVADMVISGEKEGPIAPSPKNVGMIAMGDDPLLFDETIATIMGFDPAKIPTFQSARAYEGKYRYYRSEDHAVIVSNIEGLNGKKPSEVTGPNKLHYIATSGWIGHIEAEE
jgi:uncharacterized protein (DUF362 family)